MTYAHVMRHFLVKSSFALNHSLLPNQLPPNAPKPELPLGPIPQPPITTLATTQSAPCPLHTQLRKSCRSSQGRGNLVTHPGFRYAHCRMLARACGAQARLQKLVVAASMRVNQHVQVGGRLHLDGRVSRSTHSLSARCLGFRAVWHPYGGGVRLCSRREPLFRRHAAS